MLYIRKKNKTLTSNIFLKVSIFLRFKKKPVCKGRPAVPPGQAHSPPVTEGPSLGPKGCRSLSVDPGCARALSPAGRTGTGPHSSQASVLCLGLLPCSTVLPSVVPGKAGGILAFLSSPFSLFIFSEALKPQSLLSEPLSLTGLLQVSPAHRLRVNCLQREGEEGGRAACSIRLPPLQAACRAGLRLPGTQGFRFCVSLQMKCFYQHEHHRRVKAMQIILHSKKKKAINKKEGKCQKTLSDQYHISCPFLVWTQK